MALFRNNADTPMAKQRSGAPAPPGQVNIIGQGTVIEGGLQANSDVRISGKVIGNVNVEGKTVITPEGVVEGEIRSRLLKAGGVAYVREDPRAFLAIEEVIRIILDAGGIPCYPVLLDNADGEITDYESNYDRLYKNLTDLNVYSLELIPGRNDHGILTDFVHYFDEKGFVITFGTEHNTPFLDPLTITARGGCPLGSYLEQVSYRGACVIAAHQYLRSINEKGFLDERGIPGTNRDQLASLGHGLIQQFINQPT